MSLSHTIKGEYRNSNTAADSWARGRGARGRTRRTRVGSSSPPPHTCTHPPEWSAQSASVMEYDKFFLSLLSTVCKLNITDNLASLLN